MAVLTQDQWYEKIRLWVPRWFWQKEEYNEALFRALAAVAAKAQEVAQGHVDDTFIMRSAGGVLDAHGAERNVTRLSGELDPSYAVRVQNLFNQSNVPSLLAFIDQVLVNGRARIQEDFDSIPFLDRGYFANRGAVFLLEPWHNTFSIIVDKQVHSANGFTDREYFMDRGEAFASTSESLESVFELIIQIVNDNKALSTFYRIIELLE